MTGEAPTTDSTRTLAPHGKKSAADLPPGTLFGGDLRIMAKIGAGGMGTVYLAVDTGPLGRSCAVKVLDRDDSAGRGRFIDEARIMAALRHPNIVPVSRFGTDDATGFAYYVMDEYLPTREETDRICHDILHCPPPARIEAGSGRSPLTLSHLIDGGKALPEKAVVAIALQILSAIEAAHTLSPPVIHRDIKPSNILFAPDGRALLTDFGIAKRLREGNGADASVTEGWTLPNAAPGTFTYAAPEQKAGGAVTPATDCYSFGLVLFRALTGGMPSRTAALPIDIAPRVSRYWRTVFTRLLEPDPARRLSDPAAIRNLLEKTASHPARPGIRLWAWICAALAFLAAIVLIQPQGKRERHDRETPDIIPHEQDAVSENGFDAKGWAEQYAETLRDVLGKALDSPAPDASGRIVVPEGRLLLSGDLEDFGVETAVVLDGGTLLFSPSTDEMRQSLEDCGKFIAGAQDGDVIQDSFLPTVRESFGHTIFVTGKGGRLDHVDGDVEAMVVGDIRCADDIDSATLNVFGLSEITLNRDSLDPRITLAGCGRLADIDENGRTRNLEWFE